MTRMAKVGELAFKGFSVVAGPVIDLPRFQDADGSFDLIVRKKRPRSIVQVAPGLSRIFGLPESACHGLKCT